MIFRHMLLKTCKKIFCSWLVSKHEQIDILQSHGGSSTLPSLAKKHKIPIQTDPRIHFSQVSDVSSEFWERFYNAFIFHKMLLL